MLIATVIGLALTFPSVAATTCPGCYGMQRVGPNLYVERGLPDERRERISALLNAAERQVAAFYDGRRSSPRVLACTTARCYSRISGGGQARGIAVLNRAVVLSPRGLNQVIAAHELSHVELNERLGSHNGRIPQWFDEGLAVVVSDDRRYLTGVAADGADRCRISSDEVLPETLSDWLTKAAKDDQRLYAVSACRVSRWMDANGGRQGVFDLIERIRSGEPFPRVRP